MLGCQLEFWCCHMVLPMVNIWLYWVLSNTCQAPLCRIHNGQNVAQW